MPTLWNPDARSSLEGRVRQLSPETTPLWGSMTCPGMLAHVNGGLRMATGALRPPAKRLPLRYPPLKQLVIYLLPFPKGAPTSPALLFPPDSVDWEAEQSAFPALVAELTEKPVASEWPDHPAFGRMSRRAWGTLIYRHVDHHLRQFRV